MLPKAIWCCSHWFIYKRRRQKKFCKIVFALPKSCSIVSTKLLNVSSLLKIHYHITAPEKVLWNNDKKWDLLFQLGKETDHENTNLPIQQEELQRAFSQIFRKSVFQNIWDWNNSAFTRRFLSFRMFENWRT